jgi:hypothetical protein
VSDDIDKAAWEYAEKHFGTAGGLHWRGPIVEAFKAGASHALSRPLSEEEARKFGREIVNIVYTTSSEPVLANTVLAALQRMRTKG